MGLTKLVAGSAVDFCAGAVFGAFCDGYIGAQPLDQNLVESVMGGLMFGGYLKYKHKLLNNEPTPNSTVVRRSLALTSGLFVGQGLITAFDYLSKL